MQVLTKSVALVVALLLTSPLAAHHSLVGYENRNLVKVTGTVTRVDWFNPHVMVYLAVRGNDGKVTTQHVQMAAVGALKKRGIDKNPFAVGSTVLFEVWVPKDP